jgi:preprotein translocase subunit YajC
VNAAGFLLIIVAFGFLWFVLVRPQKRRQVAQRQMLSSLSVGDEVLTAGGLYGEVVRLDEDEVALEIAPGVEVRVARRAIAALRSGEEPEDREWSDEPEDPEQPEEPEEPAEQGLESPGSPVGEDDG